MTGHVFRPAIAATGLLAGVLVLRAAVVPRDFGVGESGYMYGWHRAGNEAEWKAVAPKYKFDEYCNGCHTDKYTSIHKSPHAIIKCENCHGPAHNHPIDPPKLAVNKDRSLCMRCHSALPYPGNARSKIPGIDPAVHNPGFPCATCHNPHSPKLGGAQ